MLTNIIIYEDFRDLGVAKCGEDWILRKSWEL
jgi:hypothetical protein